MLDFRQFLDFHVLGRHRLDRVDLLALGCTVDEATKKYGEPVKTAPFDEAPQVTEYVFAVSAYHEAVVYEWEDKIQSITYWSSKSAPTRDLNYMLDYYRGESDWQVMEEGYWYQRTDGMVRLWCSAIPAIGVAYVSFLAAKATLKTAHDLKQVDELTDVTWVPDNVVHELLRRFVEGERSPLLDLASRSGRIAVSPDGGEVLIVRDHLAYDAPEGFMVLNAPPDNEKGHYSSQAINCFKATHWHKIVLPKDADVDCIRFEGEQCFLRIRRTADGRILSFKGPVDFIRDLGQIGIGPVNNQKLWARLEQEAQESE